MTEPALLSLFEGFGIEIEYAIVNRTDLSVLPASDELLKAICGSYEAEVELGDIALSNELALHVVELKTNGPAQKLTGLVDKFQGQVEFVNDKLASMSGRLLPTAMHPWMDPKTEFRVWPHEYNDVYESYDRIFGCSGHAWANVQSTHLNLPFANDREFGRLHAAVRLVLPLVPALAASSPVVEGTLSGILDTRLDFYSRHAEQVRSVAGSIIPEAIFSIDQYRHDLLARIYSDVAPYDAPGVLQHEWLNARGAIARFDRMAIELRLTDVQECPAADIGVAAALVAATRWLVEEVASDTRRQRAWDHEALARLLGILIRDADAGIIDDRRYLDCFGFPDRAPARACDLWQFLIETALDNQALDATARNALDLIVGHGCLARRIRNALRDDLSAERLHDVYSRLADCLATGSLFRQ